MGAAERAKGVRAERAVAAWLRTHGWPQAERAVRTGYAATGRDSADPGDIIGTPGIVWQVTDRGDIDQDAVLSRRLADTEAQRAGAGADLGVLVVKRRGVADPGRWWAWHPAQLITVNGRRVRTVPARVELRHFAASAHDAGYGTPTTVEEAHP